VEPKERRKSPRVLLRALVDYESPDTYLYDYSTDLSEGGIFIETEKPLSEGTPLTLRFTLPDVDRVFELKARVAWRNEARIGKLRRGMGVQFETMDAADRKAITDYISKVL
jgi:type IV pilus assembly protein PilZ